MATYISGVTDYIPDYQPFQPDLNFYANVLQTKQTQYDSNWKSLNNLYADLHNADLTHDLNIKKKDELLTQIDFNLKRVTGLDLSLQQNVDQATQVFRPFYEDKYLMKDMAWTKNYSNTINRALNLKNAQDEKMRGQYWHTGIQEMQYRRDEFKNSTLDETLNMNNVNYTPYVNAQEKYMKLAKDAGLSVTIKDVDETGLYFVTEKNGKALLSPLQNLFMSAYANDPSLQAVYATQSYVKRKDYAEQHATKYNGDKKESEKEYLREQYKFLQKYTSQKNKENGERAQVTESKITAATNDKTNNDANPFTDSYLESLNKALGIDQTVADHSEKLDKDINGGASRTTVTSTTTSDPNVLDLSDMELARLRVDAGTASVLAEQDIVGSAEILALKDYSYEKSVNQVGLENLQHQHALSRLAYADQLKKDQIKLEGMTERETNRINNGLSDGTIWYDKEGKMHEDDGSAFLINTGDESGKSTDVKNMIAENAKAVNETTTNLTGTYIGNTLLRLKQISETTQISSKDLWSALSFFDPNSKEAKQRYNTTDGKKLLNQLFEDYQKNPGQFAINFSKSGQVTKLKSFMDKWASNNDSNIAVQYRGDKSLHDIEIYERFKSNSASIEKANDVKISKGLVKAIDAMNVNITPADKQRLADLYIKQLKSGSVADEDTFAAFVDQNLKWDKQTDERKSFEAIVGAKSNKALTTVINNEKANWTNPNFWKTAEGKQISASPNRLAAFNKYVDKKAKQFIANSVDDAALKKELNKDIAAQNARASSIYNAQRDREIKNTLNQYGATAIYNEIKNWSDRIAADPKNTKGYNDNYKQKLAAAQKQLDFVKSQNKKAVDAIENKYKNKGTTKSIYDLTPAEWAAKKQAWINSQSIDTGDLYSGVNANQRRNPVVAFSEYTKTNMDDLYNNLQQAYLQTATLTGPEGLQSYSGLVAVAGGKMALTSKDLSAKKVILSNPSFGGYQDFQESVGDINRIRFNQDSSKYAVTYGGLGITASKDKTLDAAEMKNMLRAMQLSAGSKTKTAPFIIAGSPIALENSNLKAVIIYPPQEILEKYIKTKIDDKWVTDWDKITEINKTGISFIAPKSEWTNGLITGIESTPTQQILNAKKKIEYVHGNGAGTYNIEKVSNVPGVDYSVTMTGYAINENGNVEKIATNKRFQKSGNTIDDDEVLMFNALQDINTDNLEMFRSFQQTGNTEAINRVHAEFKKLGNSGFKY